MMALRLAMHPNAVLGLLAVAAFAVVFGVVNRDRMPFVGLTIAGEGTAPSAAPGPHESGMRSHVQDRAHAPDGLRAQGSVRAPGALQTEASAQADAQPQLQTASRARRQGSGRPSTAVPREPTAEQLQTIARLSEQVMPQGETTSEDAEKRGDAIRRLATLPGSQSVQALVHAIRNDADPRNRILAVEALKRSASVDGDPNRIIRDALREASSSNDEIVAAQARAAYDNLITKLGTQR